MEIISVLFGFFLKKEIKDADEFYYKLSNELNFKLNKEFSIPLTSVKNIKNISNVEESLPILSASDKEIKLSLAKKKIQIIFEGKNAKDLNKFIKNKELIINKLFNFVNNENEIRRIGIEIKTFLSHDNPIEFLKKFVNKDIFYNKDFKAISLNLNWIGQIGEIKTNEIISLNQGLKQGIGKRKKGVIVNFDINNLNEQNLKKVEVKLFFEELKKKIISFVEGEIK